MDDRPIGRSSDARERRSRQAAPASPLPSLMGEGGTFEASLPTTSGDTGPERDRKAEANRNRSEATKAQHAISKPWAGEKKDGPATSCGDTIPTRDYQAEQQAKSAAAKAALGVLVRSLAICKPADRIGTPRRLDRPVGVLVPRWLAAEIVRSMNPDAHLQPPTVALDGSERTRDQRAPQPVRNEGPGRRLGDSGHDHPRRHARV
jgi:hypothetical protein